MSTNKSLAERLLECFNAKDTVSLGRIVSDTVKHTASGTEFNADIEGRSAFIAYMSERVFPRFDSVRFEAERVMEDAALGAVVVEWSGSFVTSAGKAYSSRGVFVIEFHDGRIDWVRDYFDTETTKRAMS